jgi:nucleotide sugar dehydrogenase
MKSVSINIIGYGYVGSSMGYLCEQNNIKFNVCDLEKKEGSFKYFNNIDDLVKHSESDDNCINYYIICVPTPSDNEGNCDTSIVKYLLNKLNTLIVKESYIIIKSTLVPGTCNEFHKLFPSLDIVLCPEFLREATCKDDVYNAKFALLGLSKSFEDEKTRNLLLLFKTLYCHNPNIEIYVRTYEECELFKYVLNVHLAVKVWYFNEIYEICDKMNVEYESLKELFPLDDRIGSYGTKVPGGDGKFGYGLSCLPKETRGMSKLQEGLGLPNDVLKNIIARNDYFRTK